MYWKLWIYLLAAMAPVVLAVQKHTIEAPGIRASYIAYGARLTNLYVPDKNGVFRDVVMVSLVDFNLPRDH